MWAKVYYTYTRENGGMSGNDMARFSQIENENIENEVEEFFKSAWTGVGSVEITAIEAGPFSDDEEYSIDLEKKFKGKIFHFDN
jgi:hypothetical protein